MLCEAYGNPRLLGAGKKAEQLVSEAQLELLLWLRLPCLSLT